MIRLIEAETSRFECGLMATGELPRRSGLSGAEERGLAARIAAGDRDARNTLVQANLGLVPLVARGYLGLGLMWEDLVGEGNLGLIRAAEAFVPSFGTRFSTYATYWIKDAILAALHNTTSTIRVPAHMVRLLSRWRRAEQALSSAAGRPPSFEEVAAALGLSQEQKSLVAKARHAGGVRLESGLAAGAHPGSAENAVDDHDGPDALLEAIEEREALRRRLDRLDSRARTILTWRYGLEGEPPMTLKEIGRRLGLTKEWVRKIARDALNKLVVSTDPGGAAIAPRGPSPARHRDATPTQPAPTGPSRFPRPELPGDPPRTLPHSTGCRRESGSIPPQPGYLARCG
jgi:RNA polymerase primary sigma factor